MVYQGYPSRGCYACRRKKVKCDETRPQCNRCTSARNICPGYRSQDGAKFQFVVLSAAGYKASHPSRSSSNERQLNENIASLPLETFFSDKDDRDVYSKGKSSSSSGRSSPLCIEMPSIPRPPTTPWEPLALPLFFNLYTASEGSSQYQGLMPYLPSSYSHASPNSCLYLSVSATAEMNAVRKLTGDEAMVQARKKYSLALAAVQSALNHPIDAMQDATLASLFVLTLFEFISGDTFIDHGSHIAGYEAILSLRSDDVKNCSMNYSLFLAVATQVVVAHLRYRTIPSARTIEVFKNLKQEDPSTTILHVNLKICILNAKATELISRVELVEINPDELWILLDEAEQLDDEVALWPSNDEPVWACTAVDAPLKDWTGIFHIYGSFAAANNWNMFRCARVLLLSTTIRCCTILLESKEPPVLVNPSLSKARAKIEILLADMIASFPYCLGRGDLHWSFPTSGVATSGFALLWPAGVVARCPSSTAEQRSTAISCIEHVGLCLGMRKAIALKEMLSNGVGY